jgi:pyrroline-5-carboxylate reductase
MYGAIIKEPGFREALGGKLVISVLAGVNAVTLDNYMYVSGRQPCHIVHVMPNTACFVHE